MKFWSGPYVWDPTFPQWRPPVGCKGGLDCRPVALQSAIGGTPGLGIFYGEANLGSDYTLLGEGNLHDIKLSQQQKNSLPKRQGYNPKGDDLIGIIFDLLTDGADPLGEDFAKPIMPTVGRRLSLNIGGQSHLDRFSWGNHGHSNKVKASFRNLFAKLFDNAQNGKFKDPEHHLKVLDYWCKKFGLTGENEWKEFVPPNLQNQIPGPKPHDTTLTENFTRPDGDTIGNLQTWAEVAGDFDTLSNAIIAGVNDTYCFARCEADLSSDDMRVQGVRLVNSGSSKQFGPVCRFSSSALTGYLMLARQSDGLYRIYKIVAGSFTLLDDNSLTINTATYKITADGSDIKIYKDNANEQAITDSSITGNLRGGLMAYTPAADPAGNWDDFEAADLAAAPGITFVQLENNWPRGYARGIWFK